MTVTFPVTCYPERVGASARFEDGTWEVTCRCGWTASACSWEHGQATFWAHCRKDGES